jgi:putative DNA primase/helicase
LGNEAFGPESGEGFAFEGVSPLPKPFGTLDDWKSTVGKLASHNSRLVFGICLAFAGVLLRPMGSDGFGVHLRGKSSTGKTTSLHVARSVGGQPPGTWRLTDNGAEGEAAAANDGFMTLDELSEVDPYSAGRIAYMLANGQGKARADQTGAKRARANWLVIYLSTGEITLADKIAEDGRKRRATAGQSVRLIDVPADAGMGLGVFENIHGHAGAGEFAKAVRAATEHAFGTALRAFLRGLMADMPGGLAVAMEVRRRFREGGPNDPQASRVREHFALVAAAGELATHFGITGWETGHAIWAAETLFSQWMVARGAGPHEDRDALAKVLGYLADQHAKPFLSGIFLHKVHGTDCTCIPVQTFREQVCAGLDPAFVAEVLAQNDCLMSDPGRRTAKVRAPGGASINVYAVKVSALEGHQ